MTDNPGSILWYDLETSGTHAASDRIYQFAAQRTDYDLQAIGEPINWLCKPDPDVLPSVDACLVTGINPQDLERDGLDAPEFVSRIQAQMMHPGTCSAGYNSLRFDDEFIRHTFWRHFHDPYAREWQNGNSRWDIIDLARLCHALRPEGIRWPVDDTGQTSFRLEKLAQANGLSHRKAHDALSDVEATIGLARLIRQAQPRLYDYYFKLRSKHQARHYLPLESAAPVLHVSSRYPRERGCLAMVLPLAQHPVNGNAVIVFDLSSSPEDLLNEPVDLLEDLLYTPKADLPEDRQRLAIKTIQLNKSPALAPLTVLREGDAARLGLDIERCQRHAEQLNQARNEVAEKLRELFARRASPEITDPERQLYDGFLDNADRNRFAELHAAKPEQLAEWQFNDPRLNGLLFNYRARYYPDSLSLDEHEAWQEHMQRRLVDGSEGNGVSFQVFFARIEQLRAEQTLSSADAALLDRLQAWAIEKQQGLSSLLQIEQPS